MRYDTGLRGYERRAPGQRVPNKVAPERDWRHGKGPTLFVYAVGRLPPAGRRGAVLGSQVQRGPEDVPHQARGGLLQPGECFSTSRVP